MFSTIRKTAFLKLHLLTLSTMMLLTMTGSIFVLYVLELGGNIFDVNLISTIQGTTGLLLLVPLGMLSDRLGRKPMFLYSRAILFVGTLIYMFALDPTHLLVASLVIGFTGGGGGFFPILLSMVGDVAKPEERQEAISTLYFFSSIGMLLGPLITSFLLTMSLTLRNIYQINIVGQAILLLFIVTQIKETKSETMKNTRTKTKSRVIITELLHQKKFQSVIIMVFLYFFYYSIINTYIPIYARIELNLSNAQVASFATFRSLATMLIRFLSATILARVPIKPFLLSALVLGGITSLISPFANNYLYIALVMALSGISFGAVNSLGGTLVAINTTPENRGVANSIYGGTLGFGNVIKILTTPIADILGLSAVFLIGGIVALTATVPILLRKMKG